MEHENAPEFRGFGFGPIEWRALERALVRLRELDPILAETVELRGTGISMADLAAIQGLSMRQVTRNWTCARAWLMREFS